MSSALPSSSLVAAAGSRALVLTSKGHRQVLELPFPQNADYKYDIYLVGPGLRPANDAECIPQDMCVPIFPTESDTSQPTNRAPLRPTPSFPFSGCYHWLGKDTELEVRVKRGIYDPKDGEVHVTLSGVQHVYMEDCYDEDSDRLFAVREAMTESSVSRESSSVDSEEQDYYYYVHDAPGSRPQADRGYSHSQFDENMDDRSSLQRSGTVVSEAFSDDHSSNELGVSFGAGDLDVFGIDSARAPERAAIPLVDCWLDISAHMTQDEIPDPFAFLVECRALSECVFVVFVRTLLLSC